MAVPQQGNAASWWALEPAGFSRWWSGQLDFSDPSDAGAAYLYGTGRPAATGSTRPGHPGGPRHLWPHASPGAPGHAAPLKKRGGGGGGEKKGGGAGYGEGRCVAFARF